MATSGMRDLLSCIAHVAPGQAVAIILLWLCWAVGAPVVAGYRPLPKPVHQCPAPAVSHLVSCPPPHMVTTKTVRCVQTIRFDRCAEAHKSD